MQSFLLVLAAAASAVASPLYFRQAGNGTSTNTTLSACGNAYYNTSSYTCYNSTKLCPVVDGTATLPCGDACYLPFLYSCSNATLVQVPHNITNSTGFNYTRV